MKLLEQVQIAPIMTGNVLDVRNQTRTGDYVNFANFQRCLILVSFADGQADDDVRLTVEQATTAAGAGAKALDALQTGRIYEKLGATDLTAVGQWTKVTQGTADEVYVNTDSGEQAGMYALEIEASDLDLANGFNWIRCDITGDANNAAKLADGVYIMYEPAHKAAPESMLSVIA